LAGDDGSDLAFETSGTTSGRRAVVQALRRGGKAAFVGVGSDEAVINPTEIIGRELTLMGSYVLPLGQTYELVDFLSNRGVSFDPIVTHRYSIDDAAEAYQVADAPHASKVVFRWE